jgi:hypothetical protein
MEEIIATQDQALDNIEPQTQAANATNAEVIKIKKEVSCSFWMACFAVSSACVCCSIAWLSACIFFSNVYLSSTRHGRHGQFLYLIGLNYKNLLQ